MIKNDLNKIYIRAQVSGKWESLSIEELFNMGEGGQAFEWALDKLNRMQGVMLTKENLQKFVDLIEEFGVGISKIK